MHISNSSTTSIIFARRFITLLLNTPLHTHPTPPCTYLHPLTPTHTIHYPSTRSTRSITHLHHSHFFHHPHHPHPSNTNLKPIQQPSNNHATTNQHHPTPSTSSTPTHTSYTYPHHPHLLTPFNPPRYPSKDLQATWLSMRMASEGLSPLTFLTLVSTDL